MSSLIDKVVSGTKDYFRRISPPDKYKVKPGDSMFKIVDNTYIDVEPEVRTALTNALAKKNDLLNPNDIKAGQTIKLLTMTEFGDIRLEFWMRQADKKDPNYLAQMQKDMNPGMRKIAEKIALEKKDHSRQNLFQVSDQQAGKIPKE